MPRTVRASTGGYCYHVLNRGNARAEVFHKDGDYLAFLDAMAEARIRVPMRVIAYCLMPNHFHFVVWPLADGDLSRWMHWLMNVHVRRYQRHYQGSGHIWQGRFKAFPIQEDEHLLTVIRYVERNPMRAALVPRAEDWDWSSLSLQPARVTLDPGPAPRGDNWAEFVNTPMTDAELEAVRLSVRRQRPFGSEPWTQTTADVCGLGFSLRAPGRPRLERREEKTT